MSHLDKLKAVFDEIGVKYALDSVPMQGLKGLKIGDTFDVNGKVLTSDQHGGYSGFFHEFVFDMSGTLLGHGSWE